jgi:pyruvate-formate lyase
VFDEQVITGAQLMQAMRDNFSGPNGETIRQLLLTRAPKWGTDDDYVDHLAVEAFSDFISEVEKYHNRRWGRGPVGGGYYSSTSTVSSNVPAGAIVGATPDGRREGESLAEGSSPHPGSDVRGPTAAIRSVVKMPTLDITGGQLLNLKFSPSEVRGDKLPRLVALIRSFAELQGWHVQFNVISTDTLRAAQANPDEYRSLMVRVAGYCALFTTLDRATQDNLIRRTEHKMN